MTWFSIYFYPLETENAFLVRAIKPFLEEYIWPQTGNRAFFIRYDDEKGRHIRLRLRADAERIEEILRPALKGWFEGRGDGIETEYQPETARFGDEQGLAWAEEYFHISTRVALERLAREQHTYGDAMFDALRMHVITAFSAGFDREKAAWYFGRLSEQWMSSFFGNDLAEPAAREQLKSDFARSAENQQHELRAVFAELWKSLENGKFDKNQPEWVRWLRGNQLVLPEFGENLEKVLPSLIHLNNNRLGVNNQDEVYLNYLLGTTL
jgi:thiopeptide-type bacteriocin biosynthesis protein